MSAIFKREFKSYFTTPIGYIFLAGLYFFLGLYFYVIYMQGIPQVEYVISAMTSIIIFILPILTMRIMSEDRRQKVDQALLTAPVGLTSIVLGKFFAALSVFAIGFAPTVIFELIIMSKVSVNFMYYLYSLIGMLLLGGALIAIGMFISSLTESTAISAILTLVINILVFFIPTFVNMITAEWLSKAINSLAFITKYENFSQNIFKISDIIYFLSIIAVFNFLCVRSLEKRRWS